MCRSWASTSDTELEHPPGLPLPGQASRGALHNTPFSAQLDRPIRRQESWSALPSPPYSAEVDRLFRHQNPPSCQGAYTHSSMSHHNLLWFALVLHTVVCPVPQPWALHSRNESQGA